MAVAADDHIKAQQALYDEHLLDDLAAGAGTYGFRKPKLVRDLWFARWLGRLDLQPGQRVLDVGCNAGARLEQLRREYGIEGEGIDLSPKTIEAGQRAFPKLSLQAGNAEQLPYADNSFDAVISFETFEHLPRPELVLREIARVLKPGGRALIYAISRRNALTWHWWQYNLTGGRYGAGSLGDHRPELLVAPEDMEQWVQRAKLRPVSWEYFHSLATIVYDEVIVHAAASLVQQVKRDRYRAKQRTQFTAVKGDQPIEPGKAFRIYRTLLVPLSWLLWLLDTPWRIFQLSDGIFVLCQKPTKPAR